MGGSRCNGGRGRGSEGCGWARAPLRIVHALEAAARCCLRDFPALEVKCGDKLLVAHIGKETFDVGVQEVVSAGKSGYRMKAVAKRFGVSGGALNVDQQFNKLACAKIPCLEELLPTSCNLADLNSPSLKKWCCRQDSDMLFDIDVPAEDVLRSGLLQNGSIAVQDESAGLVVSVVDAQPGDTIIDCCAAPGGKALNLASRFNGQGKVVAVDVNEGRLRILTEAAQQQGDGDVVSSCHYDLCDYAVRFNPETMSLNFPFKPFLPSNIAVFLSTQQFFGVAHFKIDYCVGRLLQLLGYVNFLESYYL